MSRLIAIGAVMLSALGACAGPAPSAVDVSREARAESPQAPREYTITKQIRYSYTVRNTTNRLLTKAEFATFAPVPQTSHQWLEKLTVTQPYRITRDALGNEILNFEFDQLPPYATKIVSITADLKMTGAPAPVATTDLERFVRPERYIESADAKLVELARVMKGGSDMQTAKKAYDWVARNIEAETYTPEDRGAVYALTTRKGDCTEFAYLLAALERANDIPARAIGGYVFSGNAIVKAVDYHNWTEFLTDGHWQIADAHKKLFAEHQTDFVAMRIISTASADSLSGFHRYDKSPEGLNVVMN